MNRIPLILMLGLGLCAGTLHAAEPIVGRAFVIDGDTLDIHGTRIRIFGVDAVESSQQCVKGGQRYPCGRMASNELAEWIGQRTVHCTPTGGVTYNRIVARCTVGGEDIGQHQILAGWAFDAPKFSQGEYAPMQRQAEAAERGVHGGQVQSPLEYRRNRN